MVRFNTDTGSSFFRRAFPPSYFLRRFASEVYISPYFDSHPYQFDAGTFSCRPTSSGSLLAAGYFTNSQTAPCFNR